MHSLDAVQKIEALVLERKIDKAHSAISTWLRKSGPDSESALLQACAWWRRLGLHRIALLRLNQYFEKHHPRLDFFGTETEQQLDLCWWLVRFYNLLGASVFARNWCETLPLRSDFHRECKAQILLTNYLPHEAYGILRESSFRSKVSTISLAQKADICFYAKKEDEAAEYLSAFRLEATSLLHEAIGFQMEAEYAFEIDDLPVAQTMIRRSIQIFESLGGEPSYCEYLAYLFSYRIHAGLLALPQGTESERATWKIAKRLARAQAIRLLEKLELREEVDIEFRLAEVEAGDRRVEDLLQLGLFPGIGPGLRGKALASPGRFAVGSDVAPFSVDLVGKAVQTPDGAGRLTKEWEVLGLLALAGEVGVSLFRLGSLVWPEDRFGMPLVAPRIRQMLLRLEKLHGLSVRVHLGRAFLDQPSLKKIHVQVEITAADLRQMEPRSLVDDGTRVSVG